MAVYAWPATIKKSEAGWTISLVDWPEITATRDTAPAAALTVRTELSNAVRARINAGLNIPLQSELKPGQIQITVDADAATRIESYPKEIQEKRLRVVSEIARANREKRANFLTEFSTNLEPTQRLQDHTNRGAVEFALVGVRSIYILNGGALIAIPAILQFAEKGRLSEGNLILAVIMFVTGIALSALTNFLGYRSMYDASEGHEKEINARAIEVRDLYYPPDDPSPNQVRVTTLRGEAGAKLKWAEKLANYGTGTFIFSVLVFMIGIGIIIYGLQASPGTPTPVAAPVIEFQPLDLS